MRIPLVGETFAIVAPGAAAQLTINLYPEVKDDPNEKEKGVSVLRSCPGAHLFATLSHGNVRGMWSGGGRLFVVSGSFLYEVALGTYPAALNGGAIVSSQDLGANDTLPAQLFGNRTQLGIVANGFFYIDNGTSAVKARFQLNGTVAIAGTAVTWVSGDQFPTYAPSTADPLPIVIFINGSPVAVTFTSATTATLNVAMAGGTGTVTRNGSVVWWSSGAVFSSAWVGMPIVIGGVTYTVDTVASGFTLTLVETPSGIEYGSAYTVAVANNTYSTAGGAVVTAVTGAYLDGTFFVQRPAGGTPDLGQSVNFSGVNDGTVWNGLDFFSKEGGPDNIQSICTDHELLYMLGTEESEVWQLDPASGLPVRLPGAAAREGSAARWSPAFLAETLYFIGGSPRGGPVAYRLRGFVPERISTHSVEQAWAHGMYGAGFTDGTSFSYIDQGHQFWVVNFASATAAWVYDATASAQLGTPMWHQRRGVGVFQPYRWWFHTFVPEWQSGGTHIVGDVASGKLFELSSSFGDEEGADMTWIRALQYRWNGGKQIFFGRMDLEMATGLTSSTTVEPVITRDYSDDRGHTFINPQTAGIGLHADFSRRVYWTGGGSSRGRVWRFTGTGQLIVTLIDLWSEDVDGIV